MKKLIRRKRRKARPKRQKNVERDSDLCRTKVRIRMIAAKLLHHEIAGGSERPYQNWGGGGVVMIDNTSKKIAEGKK